LYLDPLRDPLEVPLDRLQGLGGHFLKVAVHLGDEERSLELLRSLKEGQSPEDESRPACPSAGSDLRPATAATSRCRSRRRGRSLESSRSPQTQSTGEGEDPQGLEAFRGGGGIPSCPPGCSSGWPRTSPGSRIWPRCCGSSRPPRTGRWRARPGRTWPPAAAPPTTGGRCWRRPAGKVRFIRVEMQLSGFYLFLIDVFVWKGRRRLRKGLLLKEKAAALHPRCRSTKKCLRH